MADYDDGQQRSPFLVPPLPEEVIRNSRTTDKRTGGGTEKVVETAERKGVRDDIDTLEADHQRAMDTKLAHDEATAHINSQHADAALALQDRQIADRDKAYKATQVGIDEWRGRLRESMDRYDKAPAPKLWAEGATDNLLKGIGLALAGIGDAVTTRALITAGHAPTGKNTVADLIEGELARQRANIARLSDRVVTAHAGLADANAARAQLLAEVDQRGSVLFKRADLVAQSRLTGQGMDAAKVQATLDQLGWRQKSLEMKEASVAQLVNHITANHSDATGTEFSHTQNVNKPGSKDAQPSAALLELSPTTVYDVNGKPIAEASTPKLADQLNVGSGQNAKGALPAYADLRDAMVKLRDHQIKNGTTWNPLSPESKVRENLYSDLLVTMKGPNKDALGVLTGPDVGIIEGQIGGWWEKKTGTGVEQLNAAIQKLDHDMARGLASHGLKDPASVLKRYRGEASSPEITRAPPAMFVPKGDVKSVTSGSSLRRGIEPGEGNGPGSDAPLPEDKNAPHIDDMQKKAAPVSPRDRMIQLLRSNPGRTNAALAKKVYGITDAELAQ